MGSQEIDIRLAELAAARTRLRPNLRPSPAGIAPLPWRSDPVIVALEALAEPDRNGAIERLLESPIPIFRSVGIHLVIENELAEYADRVAAVLDPEIGPVPPEVGDNPHDIEEHEILAAMVIVALGRLASARHLPLVRKALDWPSTFWAAVESLALIGGDSILDDLAAAIEKHSDNWDKLDVVIVIGDVGGEFAVPVLSRILADTSEAFAPLRGYAAQALGARGEVRALPALLAALEDPTMDQKGRVLWGIGQLALAEAYDAVAPFLDDSLKDWWRCEALKAMAASNPSRATEIVLRTVRTDAYFLTNREALADGMRALGHLSTKEAAAILAQCLRATLGLETTTEVYAVPTWVGGAGSRLAAVVLTQLGRHYGVDLEPRTGRLTAPELVAKQCRTLLESDASPTLPEPLVEALRHGAAHPPDH